MTKTNLFSAGVLALLCMTAEAATVASSLPYKGTPDWTDIVFDGTSMTTTGTTSTLITAEYRGVWFGWGLGYSDPAPAWSLGRPSEGNHFLMTAAFGANAADWSAYLMDGTYLASMIFNWTECDVGYCYTAPVTKPGVTVFHADMGSGTSTYLPLDLTKLHTFEFLLKNGHVAYRVDGDVVFAGDALPGWAGNPLMVVGDGSGATPTGRGAMTIYGTVAMDNAPTMVTLVPEPETYAMFVAGLGLIGLARQRAKTARAGGANRSHA